MLPIGSWYSYNTALIVIWQGPSGHGELPRQPQPEPVDKWSLLRQPSLSVAALDDIVTKILNDDSTDGEPALATAPIGHETSDVMLHADQWDHARLSKSQSCTSDVFSFDGYKYIICSCCASVVLFQSLLPMC